MSNFVHLHVHTQYSILDGASSIKELVAKAKSQGMKALAITDHGNMFGVKEFVDTIEKTNAPISSDIKRIGNEITCLKEANVEDPKIKELEEQQAKLRGDLFKPIIGCEAYISKKSRFDRTEKEDRSGYHLILLAKNLKGYHNLVKLVSYSWIEGFYYKPRIDKELLRKYNEGIIATSACLGGEIPQAIMAGDMEQAEQLVYEYRDIFGDDFYLEIMLHPNPNHETYHEQKKTNVAIMELSRKTGVKCVATNDVHFINAEDAEAHDRLICINTATDVEDANRLVYTKQEYLKSPQEMFALFPDWPETIANTCEVADKVEPYSLRHEAIMPDFPLPEGFADFNEYLKHITFEGARKRWGENLSDTVTERLNFELEVIARMGYPSYFLIVWDFLKAARDMGVSVGPGRGSAAGSAVAYCLRITDIDPIKYDLLFERFLNPERISMPDIDIDFDEEGREEVLRYVVNKYGKKRVAHIITFGTMAAKMAIRDVGRVQKLDLPTCDRLAKLVPERAGVSLKEAFKEVSELAEYKKSENPKIRKTLQYAEVLEGSVRQTGVHACGIIIGRDDLEEHIPLSTAKDTELYVTQFEGSHVEDVGLLKMDFLGLKTLSIIKDALVLIKEGKGVEIDMDSIPLNDSKTFQLFSNGDTTAIFQFESPGMKKHLRALKPNRIEDLIAMNALYRPGPLEYIPSFINRKHGREKIEYDIPEMEEYLKDTYGITVYQEQVMLLSQKLAGFTKGQADTLRKAMGKKQKDVMDKMKEKFVAGCSEKGYDKKRVEKIWTDWEAFAQYAFNKSHSTCYAYIAYQTAYIKANYPSEFMAAVLSRNLSDIKKITTFMDECRRMGLQVLGPDVNESNYKFSVKSNGDIRFGLGAIKGIGEGAVANIIEVRKKGGKFKDVYEFAERVNLQTVNKKNIEALVIAGAFDNISRFNRAQYFATDMKGVSFAESLIRYGSKQQSEKNNIQQTLFGDGTSNGFEIQRPEPPNVDDWMKLEKLNREKELIGIYLSAHPLDDYKIEIDSFCNTPLSSMHEVHALLGRDITIAGIVTSAKVLPTKKGTYYCRLTLEDYTDSYEFSLFGKDFEDYRKYFYLGYSIMVKGKVEPNKFRNNEPEFRVKSMHMLSEVREDMVKSITININLSDLDDILMEELNSMCEANQGKTQLRFRVFDPQTNLFVDLFSRNTRISIQPELIEQLERLDLKFKVN